MTPTVLRLTFLVAALLLVVCDASSIFRNFTASSVNTTYPVYPENDTDSANESAAHASVSDSPETSAAPDGLGRSSTAVSCPGEDWLWFNGRCYWRSTCTAPWDNIPALCQLAAPGARPVSIHSDQENYLLHALVEGDTWIGLRRHGRCDWSWSDGSPLDLNRVRSANVGPVDHCAYIPGDLREGHGEGHWLSRRCEDELFFACETDEKPCTAEYDEAALWHPTEASAGNTEQQTTEASWETARDPWLIVTQYPCRHRRKHFWELTTGPWGPTTGSRWGPTTGRPWGRTTGGYWETTTGRPWGRTTGSPWETTTGRPWRRTTGGYWETTTGRPWRRRNGGYWETTTGRPWRRTTGSPWETTTGRPWGRTTGGYWGPTTGRPWGRTTGSPWETTTGRPWRRTTGDSLELTRDSWEAVTGDPGQQTRDYPWGTNNSLWRTTRVPWRSRTRIPWRPTRHPWESMTTKDPCETTEDYPSPTEYPWGPVSKIPWFTTDRSRSDTSRACYPMTLLPRYAIAQAEYESTGDPDGHIAAADDSTVSTNTAATIDSGDGNDTRYT